MEPYPVRKVPKLPTDTRPLSFVSLEILAPLSHLDLSAHVVFDESEFVGSGAYGDVWKKCCTLPDGRKTTVAIKRLRFYLKEDIKALFEKEIYVWSKLAHANILPLFGYAFDDRSGYPLLVSEWMANGSAWDYVRKNTECDLVHLVAGIAEGLAYLHKMDVIHSDIKPENIVVTCSGDARICDFGGSRMIAASRSLAKPSTGIRGTWRYMAYELITLSERGHTKESDVWAFGMTVFALLTHQRPYAHWVDAQVPIAIAKQELPVLPSSPSWTSSRLEAKETLWSVCQICWNHDPESRADMISILASLKDVGKQNNMARLDDAYGSDGKSIEKHAAPESNVTTVADGLRDIKLSEEGSLHESCITPVSKSDVTAKLVDHRDLEEDIMFHRTSLSLQPEDHPDRSTSLDNLATSLSSRFQKNGRVEDIDEAITLGRAALALRPEGHPDRSTSLNNLAKSLRARFGQSARMEDIKEVVTLDRAALALCPEGHPDRFRSLDNLAESLRARFDKSARMKDIKEAITLGRAALALRPEGHPDRSTSLNNLARSLRTQFGQSARMEDIKEVVMLDRAALALCPEGHPDRFRSLNNLAESLRARFDESARMKDIKEAITLGRAALALCPEGHPDRSTSLNDLACDLRARFGQSARMEDIKEAITLGRAALALCPEGHPDRFRSLDNLARSLRARFDKSARMKDIKEAITLGRAALALRPEGHPGHSSSLNNLALYLSARFEESGLLEDLEELTALRCVVVAYRPQGHPD